MRTQPLFSARWRDRGAATHVYELEVVGPQSAHGLRFEGDSVRGWVVLDDDARLGEDLPVRSRAELQSLILYPGDSVHLKLADELCDGSVLTFLAKDAAGWWHVYSHVVGGTDDEARVSPAPRGGEDRD